MDAAFVPGWRRADQLSSSSMLCLSLSSFYHPYLSMAIFLLLLMPSLDDGGGRTGGKSLLDRSAERELH